MDRYEGLAFESHVGRTLLRSIFRAGHRAADIPDDGVRIRPAARIFLLSKFHRLGPGPAAIRGPICRPDELRRRADKRGLHQGNLYHPRLHSRHRGRADAVRNQWIGEKIVWLGRPDTAIYAIWLVGVWQNTAYVTLILLAGLRSLPTEPLEAASIDGANRLQAFWLVTLPMLRPYILVALLLRTIFEFRAFDNIYAMTGGGPE